MILNVKARICMALEGQGSLATHEIQSNHMRIFGEEIAGIRVHLARMARAGLVKQTGTMRPENGWLGRPPAKWTLTAKGALETRPMWSAWSLLSRAH